LKPISVPKQIHALVNHNYDIKDIACQHYEIKSKLVMTYETYESEL